MTTTRGKRLRAAREKRFKSGRAAAIALGLPVATFGAHERAQSPGGRDFGPEEAERYAKEFGVTPEWLLTGYNAQEGHRSNAAPVVSGAKLSVVGYVGKGAAVHLYEVDPAQLEQIEPRLPLQNSTVALDIRDPSIMGPLAKNWLLLYEDDQRRPTPDLIGKLCVVAHDD